MCLHLAKASPFLLISNSKDSFAAKVELIPKLSFDLMDLWSIKKLESFVLGHSVSVVLELVDYYFSCIYVILKK